MKLADHRRWRTFRGALTVLLALAWSGVTRAAEAAGGGAAKPLTEADRAALVDTLDRVFKVVQAFDEENAAELEPAGVVRLVGKDPQALLKWAQSNTYWVPYQGLLRGSSGVLMDHLGNSLDRSLLVADLLNASGTTARLARCRLDERAATEALKRVRRVPADWRSPAGLAPDLSDATSRSRLAAIAQRFGLDSKLIDPALKKAGLRGQLLAEAIANRCAEQTPALLALAAPAAGPNARTQPGQPAPGDVESRAIADHWWVQANIAGQWVDLDPTFSDADRSALAIPAAQAVFDRQQAGSAFAIPDESTQRVEIQVIAERTEGTHRSESVVLSKVLRPIDVLGRKVSLGHVGVGWPEGYAMYSGNDGNAALREAAIKPREWVPVLSIGADVTLQSGVRPDGSVDPKPNLSALAQTGKSVSSGLGAAMDALNAREDDKPEEKPAGQFTAERIDYRLLVPGRPVQVVSRYLFDLTGAKARATGQVAAGAGAEPPAPAAINRSLALLGGTEILLQPCGLSPDAASHLIARAVLANRDVVLEAARAPFKDAKSVSDWGDKIRPVPGAVYSLAASRFAYGRQPACYLDEPSIITSHDSLVLRETGLRSRFAFDIVSNPVAVQAYAAPDAYRIRVAQGLCDTVAEFAVLHGQDDVGNAADRVPTNTSEAFGNDLSRHSNWVRIGPGDGAKLDAMTIPDDVRERIRAEVGRGDQVVLSSAPASPAQGEDAIVWWSIDPTTGQTLGMAGNGWGATAAENTMLIRVALKEAIMFICIGKALGGGNYGSAALCYLAGGLGIGGVAAGGAVGAVISAFADVFSLAKALG